MEEHTFVAQLAYGATEELLPHGRRLKKTENAVHSKQKEVIALPGITWCIMACKLFEFLAFHGVRAVLVLYLTLELAYSVQSATIIFHTLNMGIYLVCIIGAILADSWLGKYRTVLYMLFACAIGVLSINLSSISVFNLPGRAFMVIALLMIAVGSGCLKPCLIALGADQFNIQQPQRDEQLAKYYSLIYITLTLSQLCGAAITPMLRSDIKCFGKEYCFAAAFSVPSVSIILAIVVLLVSSKFLEKKMPQGNILFSVSSCIWTGVSLSIQNRKFNPKPHWLDHAEPKYGRQLINEIKMLLNIVVLALPIPMVFALLDQTGSRWTLQAMSLDGDLGFYTIKPDQMQSIMSFFVIMFILLLDSIIYPFVQRFGIKGPLRRMVFGSFMAAIAYFVAGILELHTEPSQAVLPIPGYCQVRFFNSLPYGVTITSNSSEMDSLSLPTMGSYQFNVRTKKSEHIFQLGFNTNENQTLLATLTSNSAISFWIQDNQIIEFEDNPKKDLTGLASFRILLNDPSSPLINIVELNHRTASKTNRTINSTDAVLLPPSKYQIILNDQWLTDLQLGPGSVTTILIRPFNTKYEYNIFEITPPNTVHMLWMLPQYLFLAMAEAMVGVTGLNFAYSEAPESMKTVLQAIWLFTVSAGNMIDIIIMAINIFKSQSNCFIVFLFAFQSFFFASLMVADSLLLMSTAC